MEVDVGGVPVAAGWVGVEVDIDVEVGVGEDAGSEVEVETGVLEGWAVVVLNAVPVAVAVRIVVGEARGDVGVALDCAVGVLVGVLVGPGVGGMPACPCCMSTRYDAYGAAGLKFANAIA